MQTIVIIDDEFGLADVLTATLSDAQYRVFAAVNGAQGMEVMAEHPPDVVLLDYMMPVMDGPMVLRAMRADAKLSHVPVILMSAMPETVVKRRTSDYAIFLRKPFDFDAVLEAVVKALEGAQAAPPHIP
jgi:DNA-binding response OmpR family regulator